MCDQTRGAAAGGRGSDTSGGGITLALFHHHHDDPERPEDAASFEVLGDDGVVRLYARQDFDQIFSTTDAEEAQRQVAVGWVILDERQVETPGSGPSGEDLIPGIEGLRVGGVLGYVASESRTSYVVGFLKDGASGQPVD
jgi:hypothetical protein